MATSARERQRKRSARLREMGLLRTSVIISEKALSTLRQITAEHNVTQSQVIELGILAASKWLAEGGDDA
ncbi:TPA: hypothetical protein MDU72_004931 [Klebsiella pneumoniae]|uniref:hypothetical protein n=1 Tax=Klebsiella pneumoniae TaxID=573 RepID=UPI0008599FBB|nr:hypothetical protein [Klebsiella pneumoniae]OEJ71766.1 hypothetical protein BHU60_23160 [Klebsiella pneumoniae]HBV3550742.1 hypothetical protein [Klebsiella pneumoniae]